MNLRENNSEQGGIWKINCKLTFYYQRLTCSRGILTEGLSHKLLCICCYVGSDEDSDEDSDDESDWDEDDEESEEEGGYDLDICPPGCDQVRLVVCNGFFVFFLFN